MGNHEKPALDKISAKMGRLAAEKELAVLH